MALLLDVSKARPYDPAVLRAGLRRGGLAPSLTVTPLRRVPVRIRLHRWELGDGAALLRWDSTGVSAARSGGSGAGAGRVTVAVVSAREWMCALDGRAVPLPAEQESALLVLDDRSALDFRCPSGGTVVAVQLDRARLAVSEATWARARRGPEPESALYGLVRTYVQQLVVVAATDAAILPELLASTTDLVRALILDVAATTAPTVEEADVAERIRAVIDERLDDPGLCAASIAAACNMSSRQLYKLWAGTGIGLADYIIGRRLEDARATLRTHRHLTVSAVARRHGFSDATHFARRFRAAYAMTPSQWRDGVEAATVGR